MTIEKVGTADTWQEAFDFAHELLSADELTAVAIARCSEADDGTVVAKQLNENGADPVKTLEEYQAIGEALHGNQELELRHGELKYSHPSMSTIDGNLLIIVVAD